MASFASTLKSQLFFTKPISNLKPHINPSFLSFDTRKGNRNLNLSLLVYGDRIHETPISPRFTRIPVMSSTMAAAAVEGEDFVAEMRAAAMRLHTRDQAKEGVEKAEGPEGKSIATWKPTIEGYVNFLVDSKVVHDAFDRVLEETPFPFYAELRNTGLERSESLAKDLEWFKEESYTIPKASDSALTYASYIEEIGHKDPHAFTCHLYNIYFGHNAGGRTIGKMVSERLLNKKELEFYKYDEDFGLLAQNTRGKLNEIAQGWTREEKNHCVEEIRICFKYVRDMFRVILT